MLALAIAVVIGTALNTLIKALVDDFIIIGFVAWRISKALIKPDPEIPKKDCPYCRMSVDAAATRCAYCTSELSRA